LWGPIFFKISEDFGTFFKFESLVLIMERKGAYYTEELGEKVAATARPAKISKIHLIYSNISHTWSIVPQGRLRALRIFSSKSEATFFARKTAIRLSADFIIIHDKNGEVASRIPVHKKTPP
jgi:hypothetical protein